MSTIRLTARFSPLMFLLFFFSPRVILDGGEEQQFKWRKPIDLPVSAGDHRIRVYFSYIIPRKAGNIEMDVSLQEGETVELTYKPAWLVTMPGRLRVAT